MSLERFLKGEPLNPRLAAMMRGEDEDEEAGVAPGTHVSNYADGVPVTDQERGHLQRMLASAGWQVLLKLLDTELSTQEDAARRISVNPATAKEEILAAWAELAASQRARRKLETLAATEAVKLKAAKPKTLCATGTSETRTATH